MLRKIVLDILYHREKVTYECNQFALLRQGLIEVLARKKEQVPGHDPTKLDLNLSEEDDKLLLEIFWDLFLDKVITLGLDGSKPGYPFFRFHSGAKTK